MNKSNHFSGHPIIKQLLKLISPAIINRTDQKHQSDRYYKRFKTYDHLVTMLYGTLSGGGAGGKIPVFGMLKRNGKVYTQVVKNCKKTDIMPIIEQKASKDSTVYTDGFKVYDGLVNYGYKRHFRVKHGQNEFANGANHINGIENFWGLHKVRLSRFRGIHKHKFYYHLKECEWRYNYRRKICIFAS